MKELNGIGASNGVANAKTYILVDNKPEITKSEIQDIDAELIILDTAVETAKNQILKLKEKSLISLGEEKAAVFDAHLGMVSDPAMLDQARAMITTDKVNASFAMSEVAKFFMDLFLNMDDEYMQERAADVSDVTQRIIKIIEGIEILDLSLINSQVIIVAHDLTPSETSQLNPEFVRGFVTEIGGRTSHSAIMARSLEIPAIVGVGSEIFELSQDKEIVINGGTGKIVYEPTKEQVDEFLVEAKLFEEYQNEANKFIDSESVTLDG
jgi:phosphotransferase system enzyme I (PtsI)